MEEEKEERSLEEIELTAKAKVLFNDISRFRDDIQAFDKEVHKRYRNKKWIEKKVSDYNDNFNVLRNRVKYLEDDYFDYHKYINDVFFRLRVGKMYLTKTKEELDTIR